MLKHAAEPLVTDDRLAFGERLIDVKPLADQRAVADALTLMRPDAVVVSQVFGNEKVEVL